VLLFLASLTARPLSLSRILVADRLVFFIAITLLAFANVFLNPDYLVNGDAIVLQTFRIALCTFALLAPAAILFVFLPHKRTSRWKLPLRIMLQLAAVGMLALNAFAWVVRDSSNESIQVANVVLSYIMLAVAWLLIATMAVFFFIFVGFRGAQLQKKREDLAESLLHEEDAVSCSRAYIHQRRMRRTFVAWRDEDVAERGSAGGMPFELEMPARSRRLDIHQPDITDMPSELKLSARSRRLDIHQPDVTVIQFENMEISPPARRHSDSGSGFIPERRSSISRTSNSSLSNKLGFFARRVRKKLGANSPRASLDTIDDEEMEERNASLRWVVHKDNTTGARYYCNAGTGESRWSLPLKAHPLPKGWTEHLDPSSEETFYQYTPNGATTYDHPGFNESDEPFASGSRSRSGLGGDAPAEGARVGTLVDEDSDEDALIGIVGEGRKKACAKGFMRWKFVAHASISLAQCLLHREGDDGDLTRVTATPQYLTELLQRIFTDSDMNDSGALTDLELTAMLTNRAKGSEMTFVGLRAILAEQSDGGPLRVSDFERGVVLEMARDGNGTTAQWILNELMDAAEFWFERRSDAGDPYWEHSKGEETTWLKPRILIELIRVRRCLESLEVSF
jgi:hypothetical protein